MHKCRFLLLVFCLLQAISVAAQPTAKLHVVVDSALVHDKQRCILAFVTFTNESDHGIPINVNDNGMRDSVSHTIFLSYAMYPINRKDEIIGLSAALNAFKPIKDTVRAGAALRYMFVFYPDKFPSDNPISMEKMNGLYCYFSGSGYTVRAKHITK